MSIPESSFELRASRSELKERAKSRPPRDGKPETGISKLRERGISLIELVVFIVIVGAAVAGIIGVINVTTRASVDPMIHKQALAIAEAMMEEVRLQPFTYCDPDDPGAATADLTALGSVTIGTIASASSNGSNSQLDVPNVNLTGQNAVLVFIGYTNNNNETVTSVVIDPGGASQTNMGAPLASIFNTQSGNDDGIIYVYGLVNPPQGTFTVRATFSATLTSSAGSNMVVYPLSGVKVTGAFGTPGTSENDSSSSSVTIPSAAGDLVFAGVTGETLKPPTLTSAGVADHNIYGGGCSGSPPDCNNHLATAHRDGAASSVNFTWSHDNDHWAAAGVSVKPAPGCPLLAETMGPEPGETRYSSTLPFDNVNDYHGFDSNTAVPSGIRNIDGTAIAGLDGYRVTVSISGQTLGGIGNDVYGNPQSLLITVTVTGPGNTTVTLNGYRTRYAPNSLP